MNPKFVRLDCLADQHHACVRSRTLAGLGRRTTGISFTASAKIDVMCSGVPSPNNGDAGGLARGGICDGVVMASDVSRWPGHTIFSGEIDRAASIA
jgi:hypothetical protein